MNKYEVKTSECGVDNKFKIEASKFELDENQNAVFSINGEHTCIIKSI